MPKAKRRIKAPVLPLVQWLFLGGLGLVVAGLLVYHVTRETKWWLWAMLGAGGASILASLALNRRAALEFLKARATRYSAAVGANFLIVFGIAVAVNYISSLRGYRIDFTQEKRYTLSPQTAEIVKGIKHPVTVTAFYGPDSWNYEDVRILLEQYKELGKGKIKVRFVDPDKNPALARTYGITMSGTTVFECQGRREETTGSDEKDFTSTLLKVVSPERKRVYFLQGHGERDPESYEDLGYSHAKEALERERFVVEKLNLLVQKTIPEACDVLVVAGPEKPLMKEEVEEISRYLNRGGKALFLLEPSVSPRTKEFVPMEELEALLEEFGIEPRRDIVLDPGAFLARGFFAELSTPVVAGDRIKWHEITRPLTRARGPALFFPTCRSFKKQDSPPSGVTVDTLLETTDQSWGETTLGEVRHDGADHEGPLAIALAAEKEVEAGAKEEGEKKKARVVAIGDADFASNQFFESAFNADLFMNSIHWLAEEEELVSIRPKEPQRRPLNIDIRGQRLLWLVTFLLPGLCLLGGVLVWWRRR